MQLTGVYVSKEVVGLCAWGVRDTFRIEVLAIASPAADWQSRWADTHGPPLATGGRPE